ncbi:RrF2 family transcriptional regulator [Planococcus lenghuensis]|uniref:Transcriptional regulator n=1 Tax=Planococcus lenghuensis TaxID=2213202 RepID=A0A1Q2KYL1_9BACL|nr:Rrf2 family transcriptional regulator [Planococcus lenghuensis]AQQ53298.1 transcriptional regulator [Planococcus lenghuensis]
MNSNFTLAVHSLTYLALQPDRMATSDAIAESASVHPVRVRTVLSLLRKNSYLQSKEGTGGGFIFRLPPSDVSLWELYKLTCDGALQPKCSKSNDDCIVGANMKNVLFSIFLGAEEHLGEYLKAYTIQDVVDFIVETRPSDSA